MIARRHPYLICLMLGLAVTCTVPAEAADYDTIRFYTERSRPEQLLNFGEVP